MSTTTRIPRVLEGTPEELASALSALPVHRYRLQITDLTGPERNGEVKPNPALEAAILRLTSRTPEEIQADRDRILAKSPQPTPIPPGKTLDDMVCGKWPGDETDEEINAALEDLS